MELSDVERAQIVKMYYSQNSIRAVRDSFAGFYPDRPIPSVGFISKLINMFEKTGSAAKGSTKSRSGQTQKGQRVDEMVLALIHGNSRLSVRDIAKEVGISKSYVLRILRKHGYKSYKFSCHQEILPRDADVRNSFCEQMFNKCNEDENFLRRICFTDECTFTLNGEPNKQIHRIWSIENPHEQVFTRTQYPKKVNVWAGILGHNIIGPFFIEGNLNSEKYCNLLENEVCPTIARLVNLENVWYQHDGCPAHYTRNVMNILNVTFPDRWIGRGGILSWPPRSPDLAPCDFFLWPHLKNKIYKPNHSFNNIEELKQAIIGECRNITDRQLANVRRNFYNRLGYCLMENGGLFENLI